jgi:hypothetical protein
MEIKTQDIDIETQDIDTIRMPIRNIISEEMERYKKILYIAQSEEKKEEDQIS